MMIETQTNKINKNALFADETSDYRRPEEPDAGETIRLSFRTAKNDVERVLYVPANGADPQEMRKTVSDGYFDYYETEIRVGEEPFRYYFRIEKVREVCFYNRLGVTTDVQECYGFCITPGFHTPEWAKGAVMYQIYVDRFCNGDPSNDVEDQEYIYIGKPVQKAAAWDENPSTMDVGCFYGGDLQGVWDKLDYLQYLGVEVIYFNPLFVSPSNHKYDSQDYDHIDPHYGTIVKDGGERVARGATSNAFATKYQLRSADPENLEASDRFFAQFMEEIHKRGMRVIMDGVFNHCGSFHKWLDREKIYANQGSYEPGAYASAESPYRTFFKFRNEQAWPDNGSYDGWWGHETLPKLNYEDSPKLFADIMRIARKWVSEPYCVDGWRLDVAADLGHSSEYNHYFWREFRKNVKAVNPDALILAEHYGDPSSWLCGDQWDTVMNYDAFMEPLSWFLTGMEKHSDEYNGSLYGDGRSFFDSMYYHMSRMQTPSLFVSMNQLSNHDHSRFLTRTNHMVGRLATAGAELASFDVNYGIFRSAVMIQMTWPGAPTLYYGDETGVCGWTDPDNRRTYPWGQEDFELIEFHRYLIAFHKRLLSLRRGSWKPLVADRHLIAYGRFREGDRCVIAVNNSGEKRELVIPVWEIGICDEDPIRRLMLTDANGYNVGCVEYHAEYGNLKLELPAYGSVLLHVEREE